MLRQVHLRFAFLLLAGTLFFQKAFSQQELMPTAHKFIVDSLAGFDEAAALAAYSQEPSDRLPYTAYLHLAKEYYKTQKYNITPPFYQNRNSDSTSLLNLPFCNNSDFATGSFNPGW